MKVGIITFHNANNYGAVLQCYALQEVIRKIGHEVEIIDYENQFIKQLYIPKLDKRLVLHHFLRLSVWQYWKYHKARKQRYSLFEQFRRRFLTLSEKVTKREIPPKYDAYIIGSDQMWSIQCGGGYDPIFFGQFEKPHTSKLIGYSISGTGDFIPHFTLEKIKDIANSFDHLSFREEKLCNLLNCITGGHFTVTVDPTLLTNSKDWDGLINKDWSKSNYVVLYQMGRPASPNQNSIYIKALKYAKSHGYELIDLLQHPYGVDDFVSAIKYAKCVFTTSFHATAFSIIFNTPFLSFCLHNGRDDRYVNLLHQLGMDDHLYEYSDMIDSEIISVNNGVLQSRLSSLSESSMSFLIESLNTQKPQI